MIAQIHGDTQISHLKGDKWGFGWNAGLLYEVDENNRYGFTYRSEVKIKFDGDYKSSLPAQYNPVPVRWALVCRGHQRQHHPRLTDLHLPEMWSCPVTTR